MSLITIKLRSFDSEINDCLAESFDDGSHSDLDEFNFKSKFIVIYCNDDIAAIGRITGCPDGYFFNATNGSNNFINTSEAVDLGRCLVTPNHRGYLYYDLLICYSFHVLNINGYKFVNGTSLTGKKMVDRLLTYGFFKSGDPLSYLDPNNNHRSIQAFTANLEEIKPIWTTMLLNFEERIKRDGHEITLELGNF